MDSEELLQRFATLISDINSKKRFGVDYSEEKREADEIEKTLIDCKAKLLNDEFIPVHSWNTKYITEARRWDIIVYKNTVCRLIEMYTTGYNEALDIFNYHAKAQGVFINEILSFDFGYYDTIKTLKI